MWSCWRCLRASAWKAGEWIGKVSGRTHHGFVLTVQNGEESGAAGCKQPACDINVQYWESESKPGLLCYAGVHLPFCVPCLLTLTQCNHVAGGCCPEGPLSSDLGLVFFFRGPLGGVLHYCLWHSVPRAPLWASLGANPPHALVLQGPWSVCWPSASVSRLWLSLLLLLWLQLLWLRPRALFVPSLAVVATLVEAAIVFLALFHLVWPITLDNTNVNPFYLSKKESPNLENV